MPDPPQHPENENMPDDMLNYLRIFIEETDEELDALVKSLLILEQDPANSNSLNEAFRLLHSLKGSSGMLGFLGISELAHQLESRFELFRSGQKQLDQDTISFILECIDFLRLFNSSLREGKTANEDCTHLIQRLKLDSASIAKHPTAESSSNIGKSDSETDSPLNNFNQLLLVDAGYLVRITFEKNLQLADLKARLILARLSNIGEIITSSPSIEDIDSFEDLPQFVVVLKTDCDQNEVRDISNVDGVESVYLEAKSKIQHHANDLPPLQSVAADDSMAQHTEQISFPNETPTILTDSDKQTPPSLTINDFPIQPPASSQSRNVAETVRVDIDRLDHLMNLTGELVMTKAQFMQLTGQINSVLRNTGSPSSLKELSERMRFTLQKLQKHSLNESRTEQDRDHLHQTLAEELSELEDQSLQWNEGLHLLPRIVNAIDQLNRVSDSLQQVVLQTRMVPVEPLFNRFNRVIRDLSIERKIQVKFVIKGENTELDKRMIDELGDPLLHLIRNSLDHGLEKTEERKKKGKPELGTIVLEASQSGNNVFITVEDDGAGINVERIKKQIRNRRLANKTELNEMADQQIIEYIWHPGFSTAEKITDISGRGVGMDIVKSRIADLNGTVEVKSSPGQGTLFKIRLPLTLAIIRCLLVRFRNGIFSIPIDKVREIVSVSLDEIYTVQNHKTIDVRGEFISLFSMSDIFEWNQFDAQCSDSETKPQNLNVVILQSGENTLG
ncbi:MAG: chemotaxis protein CheA, partial [Gimesia sp.]|nr:chemotaxis protein CheA [Gimesia sp.]